MTHYYRTPQEREGDNPDGNLIRQTQTHLNPEVTAADGQSQIWRQLISGYSDTKDKANNCIWPKDFYQKHKSFIEAFTHALNSHGWSRLINTNYRS